MPQSRVKTGRLIESGAIDPQREPSKTTRCMAGMIPHSASEMNSCAQSRRRGRFSVERSANEQAAWSRKKANSTPPVRLVRLRSESRCLERRCYLHPETPARRYMSQKPRLPTILPTEPDVVVRSFAPTSAAPFSILVLSESAELWYAGHSRPPSYIYKSKRKKRNKNHDIFAQKSAVIYVRFPSNLSRAMCHKAFP